MSWCILGGGKVSGNVRCDNVQGFGGYWQWLPGRFFFSPAIDLGSLCLGGVPSIDFGTNRSRSPLS